MIKKYHSAQTANITSCCMSCALTKLVTLEDDSQFLEAAKDNLSQAVFLMDEYYGTWHSIIWIRSNTRTKKRVSEQLNNLAFDAYQHFCEVIKNLNAYMDSQSEKEEKGELVAPPPSWWNDMKLSLYLAGDDFESQYKYQIRSKQLTLF